MDRHLYIESYTVYRDKLSYLLERRIYKVFRHLSDISYQQCKNTNVAEKQLAQFQNAVSFVAKWTAPEVERELQSFTKEAGLDDFQECIACLYVLQVKTMADIRPGSQKHSITIDIMEPAPFLHSIYIACARVAWKQALLFGCTLPEKVKNMYQQKIHELLHTTICQAIDELIPLATIQRAMMEPYDDVREQVSTEYEQPPPPLPSYHPTPAPSPSPLPSSPFPGVVDSAAFFQHPAALVPEPPSPFQPPQQMMPLAPPPMYMDPVLAPQFQYQPQIPQPHQPAVGHDSFFDSFPPPGDMQVGSMIL